jgi:hypothetical protein
MIIFFLKLIFFSAIPAAQKGHFLMQISQKNRRNRSKPKPTKGDFKCPLTRSATRRSRCGSARILLQRTKSSKS